MTAPHTNGDSPDGVGTEDEDFDPSDPNFVFHTDPPKIRAASSFSYNKRMVFYRQLPPGVTDPDDPEQIVIYWHRPARARTLNMKPTTREYSNNPLPRRPFVNKKGQRVYGITRKHLRQRLRTNAGKVKDVLPDGRPTVKAQRYLTQSASDPQGELAILYKPIEEWDHEELARGRPRDKDGGFTGNKPRWLTREMHEEAITRFKHILKDEMNVQTGQALQLIASIMRSRKKDHRGKPVVAASTKLDAAKFLIEHAVGKPKVHTEADISVKLQGLLASAVVIPNTVNLPAPPHSAQLASPASLADLYEDADIVEDDTL